MIKCCICGKRIVGYGNNPYPVVDDDEARCCDECNSKYVIVARLARLIESEKEEEDAEDYR